MVSNTYDEHYLDMYLLSSFQRYTTTHIRVLSLLHYVIKFFDMPSKRDTSLSFTKIHPDPGVSEA